MRTHPFETLKSQTARHPDRIYGYVLKIADLDFHDFHPVSWQQFYDRVRLYGLYLRTQGLRPGDRVAILARNGIEWIALDLAAMASGFVTVPLYLHSHSEEWRAILDESETKLLICDQVYESIANAISVEQRTWAELEKFVQAHFSEAETFTPSYLPEHAMVSIVYTSGTSGQPKGVVHSAENFLNSVETANQIVQISQADVMVSYLPLSHVVERTLIEFAGLISGAQIYFLDRVEKLPAMLPKIRPTTFHAVPRVWEMMATKVSREIARPKGPLQRLRWLPKFAQRWIIGRAVLKKLGLDRIRMAVSGAARLNEEAWQKFKSWGLTIQEAYGLTENMGLCSISNSAESKRAKASSVGLPYPGVDFKFAEDGEICMRARYLFKGYYKHPEWDAEVMDAEGWFHTGDVGRYDERGNITVTDRKKSIFKTSNGKYVAPQKIESLLKGHPAVREVVLIGEDKPFCVALASVDIAATSEASLTSFLHRVNARLAQHEQVKVVGCMEQAWAPVSGELTPTLKVKRKVVLEKYQKEIAQLYDGKARIVFFSEPQSDLTSQLRKEQAC